jgi:hypothetical protein
LKSGVYFNRLDAGVRSPARVLRRLSMRTSHPVVTRPNSCAIVLALVVLTFLGGAQIGRGGELDNPFAGSWSGTLAVAGGGVVGTIEWTISDAGRLTGTSHRIDGANFTLVGHLGGDGNVQLRVDLEGGGGGSGDPWAGEAIINGNGQTVATIAATYGRSPHFETPELVLTLDPVP